MKNNKVIKNVLFTVLILSVMSCSDNKSQLAKKNNNSSALKTLSSNSRLHYIRDSLTNFLTKISLDESIQKSKIAFVHVDKEVKTVKVFHYFSRKYHLKIDLIENYDSVNYLYVYKGLNINGKSLNHFINQLGSKWDQIEMDLGNDLKDDSILANIFITPNGNFLLFSGSPVNAATENWSDITYNFLIPLNNFESKAFMFPSFNVPDYFYLGYQKKRKQLFYLDIPILFSPDAKDIDAGIIDSNEYEYYIKARYIDTNHKFKTEPVKDDMGKEYLIKVAIPSKNNVSKYRIIDYYWWTN